MKAYLLPLSFLLVFSLSAQEPDIDDFRFAGDARRSGGRCIDLTYDRDWSSGSIWHKQAIRLSEPFRMQLRVMLGCKDDSGADGMVFVFHPHDRRVGYSGEGMGFAGLRPSIGLEIDTWQNEHLGDPYQDHVALLRDGSVQHFHYNLAGPVRISNIEDCREHKLQIEWLPDAQQFTVEIDGNLVLQYRGDLVREVFNGRDKVYWGVTSGTGQYSNRQGVCVERLEFGELESLPPLELSGLKAKKLLKGEFISLSNIQFESGSAKLRESSRRELDELARIMRQHPELKLDILGHTDNVGDANNNLRLSERRAEAVARYLQEKGIPGKRLKNRGLGESYPRHSNGTAEGRLKNRRVEFRLSKPVA